MNVAQLEFGTNLAHFRTNSSHFSTNSDDFGTNFCHDTKKTLCGRLHRVPRLVGLTDHF